MTQQRVRLASALLAALAATLLAVPGASRASETTAAPAKQPWGDAPANIGSYSNGTVLNSTRVNATLFGLPLPAISWLVQYKSMDQHGQPNVYIATILVPTAKWTGSGARPLVSYQFAEDGVAYKCAPSYALTSGLSPAAFAGGEPPGIMISALHKGWAVVVPDYEGPRSEFTGRRGSAHSVLDAVRAAKRFPPAGISGTAPVGLWGYSGGALATYWAAQAQPRYAPRMRLAGSAIGGIPADLVKGAHAFSQVPGVSSAINVVFAGANRSYPERNILQYLNPKGRAAVLANQDSCLLDGAVTYADTSLEAYGVTDAELRAIAKGVDPLSYGNLPQTPTLLYQARLDELAMFEPAVTLARRLCAAGAPVNTHWGLGEHATGAILMAPNAVAYLQDRFQGKPITRDC